MSTGFLDVRWVVSIGAITATGCLAPAPRTSAPTAASTVELTPALAAVFSNVVSLPVLTSTTSHGVPAWYYDNPDTTATNEQLADARARASDCARQIAEWRRRRENQSERAGEIVGLPWPYGARWTPDAARQKCEELASRVGAAIQRREQGVKNAATLVRWTKSAQGDRGDLLRRYGLPNAAETDAHLEDRFWVYMRRVSTANVSQVCTVTYYFERDRITRTEAEPATCLTSQLR